jgi:hypothetical protein
VGGVFAVPQAEKVEQGAQAHGLAAAGAFGELADLPEEPGVLAAVAFELGIAVAFEQALLAGELFLGVVDEAAEDIGDALPGAAAEDGQAELVEGVDEDGVLVIHGADADRAGMIPTEECHMGLR